MLKKKRDEIIVIYLSLHFHTLCFLPTKRCSEEPSLSFYPLSNFIFGFRFQAFKFVGYDLLYIHCNAIVCLAADNTRECDRTCGNTKPNATVAPSTGRRRRDAYIHYTSATSPAILICDPYAPGRGKNYFLCKIHF